MYIELPNEKLLNLSAVESILTKPSAENPGSFEVAAIGPRFSYLVATGTAEFCTAKYNELKVLLLSTKNK